VVEVRDEGELEKDAQFPPSFSSQAESSHFSLFPKSITVSIILIEHLMHEIDISSSCQQKIL
jgi:hypothetical protein